VREKEGGEVKFTGLTTDREKKGDTEEGLQGDGRKKFAQSPTRF